MPKYEVFIKSGFDSATIEADNAEYAAKSFANTIRENIGPNQIEVNEIED